MIDLEDIREIEAQKQGQDQLYQNYDRLLYRLTGTEMTDNILDMLSGNPGANNASNVEIAGSDIGSGVDTSTTVMAAGGIQSGKKTFDNTVAGFILGFDPVTGLTKFYIGNATKYINWDGLTFTVVGAVSIGQLDIPDTVTANSFHVDSTGNAWWGSTTLAGAVGKVLSTGAATFSNITVTGGSITGTPIASIPNTTATDISLLEMSHNLVFSVTDADTIAWSSGTIVMSNGRTFTISAGNTGNMAALTYIYLDTAVSSTVLQTTTTYSTAMGANKRLIGTAQNNTVTASFIPYGPGQMLVDGANIGALSIVTGSLAAGAVTAVKMSVTQLSAITADLGAMTAGSIVLPSGGFIRSGQTAYDTGTGFYLGNDAGTPKFSIGNSSGDKFTWSGSALTVQGTLQTAASGSRVVITSSDNTLRFYNASGQRLGLGSDASYAIRVDDLSTGDGGVSVFSSIASTIGFLVQSTSNVAVNGMQITLSSSGASNSGYGVLVTHAGVGRCIDLAPSGTAAGVYINSSGGIPLQILHSNTSYRAVDIAYSGNQEGMFVDSSATGALSALSVRGAIADFNTPVTKIERTAAGVNLGLTNTLNTSTNMVGIQFNLNNSGSGVEYAFDFNGSEYISAAVGGTQNRKIKVIIGGAAYYIPAYDA